MIRDGGIGVPHKVPLKGHIIYGSHFFLMSTRSCISLLDRIKSMSSQNEDSSKVEFYICPSRRRYLYQTPLLTNLGCDQ